MTRPTPCQRECGIHEPDRPIHPARLACVELCERRSAQGRPPGSWHGPDPWRVHPLPYDSKTAGGCSCR